jgi:hypothetical protein
MFEQILSIYHKDAVGCFHDYKRVAERAIEQISEEEFFKTIDGRGKFSCDSCGID